MGAIVFFIFFIGPIGDIHLAAVNRTLQKNIPYGKGYLDPWIQECL